MYIQYKCYNTVANIGVWVNRKIKVKPIDENILCVLSLRSTVILKDNIIQVFQFYICGTITIKTAVQCQNHLESDQPALRASSLCLLFLCPMCWQPSIIDHPSIVIRGFSLAKSEL